MEAVSEKNHEKARVTNSTILASESTTRSGANRIFGKHTLRARTPEKLRLAFDPEALEIKTLLETDGKIEYSIGET